MPPPDFAVLPYRRSLLPDARSPFPPAISAGIRIWTPPQNLRLPVQKFQLNIRKPDSNKMRMVQFLFHSSFSHDFISFLLSVTSVTPQTGEPAVLPESSFVLRPTFQWTPISARSADHRGYGESKSQARALLRKTR